VVTLTDVQLLQPIQDMIFQFRDEVLESDTVSIQLGRNYNGTFTLRAGSPSLFLMNAYKETGLFRPDGIEWCPLNDDRAGVSTGDSLFEVVLPAVSATRHNTRCLRSCFVNCAGVSSLLVKG
jgi:hypothetical protein